MVAVFEVGATLVGACIGSFLNVVVHRLPQEDPRQRTLGGRSRCPHCGTQIRWHDNVPVLGWLWLRGRARCCQRPIAVRYPAVELLTALLFLALAHWQPFGAVLRPLADGGGFAIDVAAAAGFALQAVFLALLVANAFIDLDTRLLLDVLTKPGMALGLAAGLWPGLAGPIAADPSTPLALRTLLGSLAGLLAGGGVTWLIRSLGSKAFGQEAMGFGDVKFMGMIGAFLGWRAALLTMFLGCVFGALAGGIGAALGRGNVIPFGPYLALGAVVALFAEAELLHLLFVTWPEWQQRSASAPWLFAALAFLGLGALWMLLRRRRLG